MNIHSTFSSKKATDEEKLECLLQEVDIYLTEGIKMDKKCKKEDAIKAYSVAIELMDFALERFPIEKKCQGKLMKLVMKFHHRCTLLRSFDVPEQKKTSELLSVVTMDQNNTPEKQEEVPDEEGRDDEGAASKVWQTTPLETQIAAMLKSPQDACGTEQTIPLSLVEEHLHMKIAEYIDKGLLCLPKNSEEKDSTEEEKEIRQAIMSTLVRNPQKVAWDDVIGFDEVKTRLSMAVVAPIMFKDFWVEQNMESSGILLYGPPGTGKTMLSLATSTASGQCTYFKIASSDVVSKWQGQSERLVKCLFQIAEELQPSLIFIDEVEGLFSSRSGSDSGGSRRITNELLTQMQGQQGIFVLATTNRPWEIDSGFFRRFSNHVYIKLPTKKDRKKMWEKYLSKTDNVLLQRDYWFLAQKSENYSGADIAAVVKEVKQQAFRRCLKATFFRPFGNKYSPCTERDPQSTAMTTREVPGGRICGTPVDMRDVEVAFSQVFSKYCGDDEPKFKEHQKKYG